MEADLNEQGLTVKTLASHEQKKGKFYNISQGSIVLFPLKYE